MATTTPIWEEKKCKQCGNKFSVIRPELYAYKMYEGKSMVWFCRYSCKRAYEAEAEGRRKRKRAYAETGTLLDMKHRDQREVLVECLDAIENGQEPIPYLRGMGYADPIERWSGLKRWARANAPELYHRIPLKQLKRKTHEKKKRMIGL